MNERIQKNIQTTKETHSTRGPSKGIPKWERTLQTQGHQQKTICRTSTIYFFNFQDYLFRLIFTN